LPSKPPSPAPHADDRDHPLRELEGRVESYLTAAAVADERRPPNAEGVEHGQQIRPVAEPDIVRG